MKRKISILLILMMAFSTLPVFADSNITITSKMSTYRTTVQQAHVTGTVNKANGCTVVLYDYASKSVVAYQNLANTSKAANYSLSVPNLPKEGTYKYCVMAVKGSSVVSNAIVVNVVYSKQSAKAAKILAACEAQSKYMKKSKYKWEQKPTIKKSKTHASCVTYVACVLQRLGYLKSGQYVWHNGSGFGTGKVRGANKKMTVTYMGNKPLSSLKNELQAGDIVMVDDNRKGVKGSGGHIFIVTGEWKCNKPYIWDNETCIAQKGNEKPRLYSGSRKVLARVRLK